MADPSEEDDQRRRAFAAGLAALGIALSPAQHAAFSAYADLLMLWSNRFNLLGPAALRELWPRHLLDALTLVRALPEGATSAPLAVLDVGSGAGLPGIPLAIAFPRWRVTLLEATGKKAHFLELAARELGLAGMQVIHGRAEEIAHEWGQREQYDLCVARAVAATAALLELTLPFVRVSGQVMLYKTSRGLDEELRVAKQAQATLGAGPPRVIPVALAPDDGRCLLRYDKERYTPRAYPRHTGLPEHQPLR